MIPCKLFRNAALILTVFALRTFCSNAQDLTIPPTWQETSFPGTTFGDREVIASRAVEVLLESSTGGECPQGLNGATLTSFISVLSLQDYFSGNTTYNGVVTDCLNNATPTSNSKNSETIYLGLAAYYAFRAYKAPSFLNNSKPLYSEVYDQIVNNGPDHSSPLQPDDPLQTNCTTDTVSSGTFWLTNGVNITADTIGPFMSLSAYLYENESKQKKKARGGLDRFSDPTANARPLHECNRNIIALHTAIFVKPG